MNKTPYNYDLAKSKAKIVFLLETLTEDIFESSRSAIHEMIRRRPRLYIYYVQRLFFSTYPFHTPGTSNQDISRVDNLPLRLLMQETQRSSRDPTLARHFGRALSESPEPDVIDKVFSMGLETSVDGLQLFFRTMVLSPLERVILASSVLVYGSEHAFGDTLGLVAWNLKSVAKQEYEDNMDTVLSSFERPMAFGDSDLSLEQAVWFISNAMRIRISDSMLAAQDLLSSALVKYGNKIIHPLLKAIYTTLFVAARPEIPPIRFDIARFMTLFRHFGLLSRSPDRDRRIIEVYVGLLQLQREGGVVVGVREFARTVQRIEDSSLPRVVQLLTESMDADNDQRTLLEMRDSEAQCALDFMHVILEFPDLLHASWPPSTLRRLSMRLSLTCNLLPSALFLTDVTCSDKENRGAGGFADIFCGIYEGKKVALKCLRVYQMMEESERTRLKRAFYHESLLWLHLRHKHVCPFLGINEELFAQSPCMVLPWAENGNIRHYMEKRRKEPDFVGRSFVETITKWLYQIAVGLSYLHSEDVVHGDLRGVNVLVEENGTIRLSDFGLSVIAETTNSFSSSFRGGAFGWLAPEIIDPEQYDLTSARPTFASDAYSYGCVCIELFTCQSPYAGLSDTQIIIRVLRGRRPPRPDSKGEEMSDAMWELTNKCWNEQMPDRPSASQIVEALEDMIRE